MATTTTNYGFDVPTSSDLVKNGATQIALLGQDLDTFLFRPFTRNGVLNSSMNVWQRGTSPTFTANNSQNYQMDRWAVYSVDSGRTITRQATGDTTNLPFIQYCARVQRTNGNTATGYISPYQPMESLNSIPFAGKTVTFSFYARKGADYSAASNALNYRLVTGTGTDENVIYPGYTGNVLAINQTATLTTTWQRFSYTATLNSTITEITPQFIYQPVGTAGAADYFEFTGVQLEVGSQATPYTPATPTYATELAACQRYYWRNTGGGAYSQYGFGAAYATTNWQTLIPLPMQLRVSPITLETGNVKIADGANAPISATFTLITSQSSANAVAVQGATTGATQYRTYWMQNDNNTAGYLAVSAEL